MSLLNESILYSVKDGLGDIPEGDNGFDNEIITCINSVFGTLNQIGVGPDDGFMIEDESTTWEDYLGDSKKLQMVKSYVILKVKQMFDPSQSSVLIEAQNKIIAELEWRIHWNYELSKSMEEKTDE